jgi:3-oxoadipate CoA-transferase beta subunit
MSLMTKRGEPKLVPGCSYPLTAAGCVRRVFTDLATFHIDDGRTRVVETFGIDVRELADRLGGTIDEDGVVSAHRAERSAEGEDDG